MGLVADMVLGPAYMDALADRCEQVGKGFLRMTNRSHVMTGDGRVDMTDGIRAGVACALAAVQHAIETGDLRSVDVEAICVVTAATVREFERSREDGGDEE